jgi:hypothetical protein
MWRSVWPRRGQEARRAGDDDFRRRPPVLHLGQDQPVGVGVRVDGAQFADDDFIRLPGEFGAGQADVGDRLHLQPGQGEPFGQLGDGDGNVHVVFEP